MLNYNGYEWGDQGPSRLTSVLELFCNNFFYYTRWPNGSSAKDSIECDPKNKTTEQFVLAILNSRYAYPVIHSRREQLLFSESKTKQVLSQLKEDKSFAIHLWNHGSKGRLEKITSLHTPYAEIISRHCPITFKTCYFNGHIISCLFDTTNFDIL